MLQKIERICYERDDQIPKSSCFKAVHQRFRINDLRCGIVKTDGPSLVIQDREKNYYLLFRDAPEELLLQIWELLKQVSVSMYMEVPIKKTETIIEPEQSMTDSE